jgi:hypothetical protein
MNGPATIHTDLVQRVDALLDTVEHAIAAGLVDADDAIAAAALLQQLERGAWQCVVSLDALCAECSP